MTDEKDGTTVWNEDGAGGSETELLPPATQAGPTAPTAWSDYQEDKPVRDGLSWKQVTLIAAAIFIPLTAVAVMIINSWLRQPGEPQVVTEPTRVVTVPPAAPPAPAPSAMPPPATVTVPPPVTVTETRAAPPPMAAPPSQGTFIVCPDGHSGVATSVTSCEFAMNVRDSYLGQGGPTVIAYSPVTGESYQMECHAGFTSHLTNGLTVNSVRCAGGNDAVVILW
jgi:hypothetical protein